MKSASIGLPVRDEEAAPVSILDGQGRVVQVVSAEEFRRDHRAFERQTITPWRRRTGRDKSSTTEDDATAKTIAS
jgi:hypothetical protein